MKVKPSVKRRCPKCKIDCQEQGRDIRDLVRTPSTSRDREVISRWFSEKCLLSI